MMWFWIIFGILFVVVCIIGAACSCQHEWKKIRSAPITYRKLFTGDLTGYVVLERCEKCKEYKAFLLTNEGEEKLDAKWVKAQLHVD